MSIIFMVMIPFVTSARSRHFSPAKKSTSLFLIYGFKLQRYHHFCCTMTSWAWPINFVLSKLKEFEELNQAMFKKERKSPTICRCWLCFVLLVKTWKVRRRRNNICMISLWRRRRLVIIAHCHKSYAHSKSIGLPCLIGKKLHTSTLCGNIRSFFKNECNII